MLYGSNKQFHFENIDFIELFMVCLAMKIIYMYTDCAAIYIIKEPKLKAKLIVMTHYNTKKKKNH